VTTVRRAEAFLIDLKVEQQRTDAVQSFLSQETVFVEITADDGAVGLGYSYTIGTGGTAVLALLRDHLLPGLWPLLVAFAASVALVPVAIRVARRTGLMAEPGGHHSHTKPTPLLGGLAMYVGFALAVLIFAPHNQAMTGVLVVSGLAAVLLIADDRWPVSPGIKLAFQVLVALVAVGVFGFVITFFGVPGLGGRPQIVELGWFAIPISLFWLLGMQNTVNFLDGVDGLAAGVVFIVALTLLLAAASTKQPEVVQVSGALAGAAAGSPGEETIETVSVIWVRWTPREAITFSCCSSCWVGWRNMRAERSAAMMVLASPSRVF